MRVRLSICSTNSKAESTSSGFQERNVHTTFPLIYVPKDGLACLFYFHLRRVEVCCIQGVTSGPNDLRLRATRSGEIQMLLKISARVCEMRGQLVTHAVVSRKCIVVLSTLAFGVLESTASDISNAHTFQNYAFIFHIRTVNHDNLRFMLKPCCDLLSLF